MAESTEFPDSGQYESPAESDKSKEDKVARWMAEIDLSSKGEEKWRKEADEAREIYRSEGKAEKQRFNIQFSNIQTEVPALYNSTPTPDVRTRYQDEDEKSRLAGQAIERVLSFSVDQYNFDGTIKGAVMDRQLAGRGQARVRYSPYQYQGKTYQEVTCELVPWKHVRLGPAIHWEDMPWIAFEHFLTRSQLQQLNPQIGGSVNLDFSLGTGRRGDKEADAAPNVFKRGRTWEIWDKQTRKVIWIAPSYKAGPIREDDDPLGLIGFYPTPEPMYAIKTTDTFVPVCPYRIIKPLADELEEITERIQALIRVCKWRGIRHPAIPSFERLEEAEDGELVAPTDGAEILSLVAGGGLDKFVWLMPVEQLMMVLKQLYEQREQIKQTIFEVSGLSDILRGQTDPNETLGAQEIKSNFGTMRLQDSQKDVARFCRDLFRLKAEIACNLFDSQNLLLMTGMRQPSREDVMRAQATLQQQAAMPPQMGDNGGPPMDGAQQGPPPQPDPKLQELASAVSWEDILEIIKSGMLRMYRIDIETDSTVRGDVRQIQQQAGVFLDGAGKFMQSIGPIVQMGGMPMDVAVDLFTGMARPFKLGKQSEDALSRWGQEVTKKAKNPQPQPPSPEEQQLMLEQKKHEAELQFKQQEMAFKQQTAAQDAQLNQAKVQQDAALKQQEFQHTSQLKEAEFAHSTKLEEYKAATQAMMAKDKMNQDHQLKMAEFDHQRALAEQQGHMEAQKMDRQSQMDERKFALEGQKAEVQHGFEREKFDHQKTMETEKLDRESGDVGVSAAGEPRVRVSDAMQQIAQALADQQKVMAEMSSVAEVVKGLTDSHKELIKAQKSPKRVVRDKKTGRVVGVETL